MTILGCRVAGDILPGELSGGILRAWSLPLAPLILLLLTGCVYLRGYLQARRTRPCELRPWRAGCFYGGLLSLWIAIASPLDALDDYLLLAHMTQHFVLMSVAPPLVAMGAPAVPLLRGLPRWVIRAFSPLFAARWLHRLWRVVMHPVAAWLAMNTAYVAWHIPAAFELTFRSESVHNFEHLCFFFTSLVFWWVVLAPWPTRSHWSSWIAIPYLLSADLVNTMLSAILAFSGRVLYPSYAGAERITRLSALQDQIAAGSEMWVLNSLVFLVPAIALTVQQLSPKGLQRAALDTIKP